jgi:hypothetical protein
MARHGFLVGGLVVATRLAMVERAECAEEATRPIEEALEVEPSECLTREALARRTSNFLQRGDVDARLVMRVTMQGDDAFFRLSRSDHEIGERVVPRRNLSCEKFLSVLAAAVAVAVDTASVPDPAPDPSQTVEDGSSAPAAPEPPSPAASPPPPPLGTSPTSSPSRNALAVRREGERLPPRARSWLLDATVETGVLAALHEPALGAALGVSLARPHLGRLGLSGFATLPVETELGLRRARVGLLAGRLDGCLAPPIRKVPIAPCAAAIVGVHRAEGVVIASSAVTDTTPWAALALGPEASIAFGRWSVVARVEPWWVLRPSRLVTQRGDGAELSKTAPHFGLGGFLGIRWSIL